MAKYANGFIPEKISYCFSNYETVNVGSAWDIILGDVDEAYKNVTLQLSPTWVYTTGDSVGKAKALSYAERGVYNPTTNKIENRNSTTIEIENKPISNLKVISFSNYNNGSHFNVVIDDKFFELRSDVMMDALLKVGVSPGGIINGEFIWAQLGKNTILVRIGSELHRLIVDFQEKKKAKKVRKKDLEFGGLYTDIRNKKAVFLGYVSTTSYNYIGERPNWKTRNNTKPDFQYKHTFKKKGMLFYEINGREGLDKCLAKMKDEKRNYGYRIVQSHSYLEKIKDVEVPDDITLFLRKQARHEIKERILEYTGARPDKSYYKGNSWYLYDAVIRYSTMLNLYAFEKSPVELFDIKKFLLFS